MGHFAKVSSSIVVEVISAEQDFINHLPDSGSWIQTSYNTRGGIHYHPTTKEQSVSQTGSLRGNFAGVGYEYNQSLDAFIVPKLYDSWILNTSSYAYEAPISYPTSSGLYQWDEDNQQWITGSI